MSMSFDNLIRVLFLLAVIVLSGCSGLQPKPKVVDAQVTTETILTPELTEMFADALTLLRDEEFDEAEQLLLTVTKKYSDYAGPWTNLAIAQLSLEKYDESLLSINKALTVDESFCQSLSLKGVILRELGQFTNSKSAYLKAIECDSSDMISLYNLGVLSDLYLHDEASALFYYQRYLIALNDRKGTIEGSHDSTVESWVVGLKRRVPEEQRIVIVSKKSKSEITPSEVVESDIEAFSAGGSAINSEGSHQPQLAGEE